MMEMGNFDDQDANQVPMLLMMMMNEDDADAAKQTISNLENADYDDHDANYPNCDANQAKYIENLVELQQLMHADAAIRLFLI